MADRLATPSDQAPTTPRPRGRSATAARLEAALQTLEQGRTCVARKAAVMQLRRLGDPRAVPGLKRARIRLRGVRGAKSNEDACLAAAADATIAQLQDANRDDQAQARRDQTRAR
jgi:hypothetical protein